MIIIPGPLSETIQEFQQALDSISRFSPLPKAIQVDIVDGEFADTLTFSPGDLNQVDSYGIPFDLHLMTIEPSDYLAEIEALSGIRRVIGQVEKMSSITDFVSVVKDDLGLEAGISLDLYTRLEDFESEIADILDQVAVVQIMGNQAGTQGQDLHPTALETLSQVVQYKHRHGLSYQVAVDIGMNGATIPQVEALGATEAVSGSYLQGPEGAKHWLQLHKMDE